MTLVRTPLVAIGALVGVLALAWATAAVWFDGPSPDWLAGLLAAAVALAGLAILVRVRPAPVAAAALVVFLGVVALWWLSIKPRNDRDWQPDVARLPRAIIDGSRVTIENVRNFDYRSETDFTERWETRTYDLDQLRGGDMFISYWGPVHIAHTIASWEFADGQHLAISIETRKERGEVYDAVRGFFRQYELYYVVADERDVIGVRTNHRGEHTYLYRINLPPQAGRAILLDYLEEVNRLAAQPKWYNALTHNCTTTIREHVRRVGSVQPWSWQLLANGHLDELWYQRGVIGDGRQPFADMRAASEITEAAKAAGGADDFSARIRAGLPAAAP